MAMQVGPADDDEDALNAAINTTPLVDVMLVLLIIFLITIPVVTHTIPLTLPKEVNQVNVVKPQTVTIAVTRDGDTYVNERQMPDAAALLERLKQVAVMTPQPEVQIRGDLEARYEPIGRVVLACERAGIVKVGFITEPPPHNG